MIHLARVDIFLLVVYFALILFIGFRARHRREGGSEDFFLAGRTLTLPAFVATLVATWYGGILGIGEYSFRYGLSNWIVLGVPYYIFALVFALFFARRVRGTHFATIPDKLYASYGLPTALTGAVLTFFLVSPAPYVLMLGLLMQLFFGGALWVSVVITALLSVVYLAKGGFRADVHVNIAEFVLMFTGFLLILYYAVHTFGGVPYLLANLPPLHLTWHGGNSWQFILVWFFIALWTLVDPGFHQRCYAARDGSTAQKGIFVSILFWAFFDLLTTTTGLYARAAQPHLANPAWSFPLLAEQILPPAAKGLFFIGLLATIMSTLSSLTFIGAMTLSNDLLGRWRLHRNRPLSAAAMTQWTRAGLAVTALWAVLLALLLPSVVQLWYAIGTAIIPGLLAPLLLSYSRRRVPPPRAALFSMVSATGLSLLWLIAGHLRPQGYWLGIEPLYPGLVISLVIVMGSQILKPHLTERSPD